MIFSKFSLLFPSRSFPNHWLVLNTLTCAIVLISDGLKIRIESPNCDEDIANDPAVGELKRLGIVVNDEFDENYSFEYWLNEQTFDSSTIAALIFLTTGCNLACKYCFQKGLFNGASMLSEEMAKATVDWLMKWADMRKAQNLNVVFWGGEPLLNVKGLEFLSAEIRNQCSREGIAYAFGISTNGVLLDDKRLNFLVDIGVKEAQVTLDGPEAIHDARRMFKNGRGTFSLIVNNILKAADKLDLYIDVNCDWHNIEYVPELLAFLEKNELKDKVWLSLCTVVQSKYPHPHYVKYGFSDEGKYVQMLEIHKKAYEMGFKLQPAPFTHGICGGKSDNVVVIDTVGDIYKCTGGAGDEAFKVGNVEERDLRTFKYNMSQYVNIDAWRNEECLNCEYLPLCQGGCRRLALIRYGDIRRKVCCRSSNVEIDAIEIVRWLYDRSPSELNSKSNSQTKQF